MIAINDVVAYDITLATIEEDVDGAGTSIFFNVVLEISNMREIIDRH